MEVSGQLEAPAASPRSKIPRYPLDSWLGRPQSRSGSGGQGKNSQYSPGIEPTNPIVQSAGMDVRKKYIGGIQNRTAVSCSATCCYM